MPYAVLLYFDQPSEAVLDELGLALQAEGVPGVIQADGLRPHLSLASCEQADVPALQAELAAFAAAEPALEIQLASVGLFPGSENVLFLAPVPTPELLALHGRFHQRLDRLGQDCHPLYRPGAWVPHVTVAMETPELKIMTALAVVQRSSAFIRPTLSEIALLEYPPYRTTLAYPLSAAG